ncbi:MAG: DNA-3-methyladenine glycosylase I [Fodinibius sp.]|nr:DNA-3-methyladenine glycosylase I [Fodinibius sp.]
MKQKFERLLTTLKSFIAIQEQLGSFSKYIWSFVDREPLQNTRKTLEEVPTQTEISDKLSSDLKNRGFKFIGSTTMYAHMQATGLVNDHLVSCFRYAEVKAMSQRF